VKKGNKSQALMLAWRTKINLILVNKALARFTERNTDIERENDLAATVFLYLFG
jgi:hypothetical protein